jgi:acyl-CoA synthetase (NDP forming)
MGPHYLVHLFPWQPGAVFGASDKPVKVHGNVYRILLAGRVRGPVYPVNARYNKAAPAVMMLGERL